MIWLDSCSICNHGFLLQDVHLATTIPGGSFILPYESMCHVKYGSLDWRLKMRANMRGQVDHGCIVMWRHVFFGELSDWINILPYLSQNNKIATDWEVPRSSKDNPHGPRIGSQSPKGLLGLSLGSCWALALSFCNFLPRALLDLAFLLSLEQSLASCWALPLASYAMLPCDNVNTNLWNFRSLSRGRLLGSPFGILLNPPSAPCWICFVMLFLRSPLGSCLAFITSSFKLLLCPPCGLLLNYPLEPCWALLLD